jgi:small nuclear ribonucleoprotein (snRNP)-like protein
MKKILSVFISVLLITLLLPTSTYAIASPKVILNSNQKTLYINSTYQLKVIGSNKKVMWKSSDSEIASVSKNGKIKAKDKGECIITVTVGAGSDNVKLTCNITVKGRLVASANTINCPLDEFQEIAIRIIKPKEGEYLVAFADSEIIDIEFGDTKDNVSTLYIQPLDKGITTLTIYLVKDYSSDNYSDLQGEEVAIDLAERESINRLTSYDIYDNLNIVVNVGICNPYPWIDSTTLETYYNVSVYNEDAISLDYTPQRYLTGNNCIYEITPNGKIIGKQYSDGHIRYRFKKDNTVEFNIEDLIELGIVY